jgi:hypothetical protein
VAAALADVLCHVSKAAICRVLCIYTYRFYAHGPFFGQRRRLEIERLRLLRRACRFSLLGRRGSKVLCARRIHGICTVWRQGPGIKGGYMLVLMFYGARTVGAIIERGRCRSAWWLRDDSRDGGGHCCEGCPPWSLN